MKFKKKKKNQTRHFSALIYGVDCVSASDSTKQCGEGERSARVFPGTPFAIIHPRG